MKKVSLLKFAPSVLFGSVSGYDHPQVVACREIENDKPKDKSCRGQACEFWEYCCMPNRVLILEVKSE
jgi:hypothetical protein